MGFYAWKNRRAAIAAGGVELSWVVMASKEGGIVVVEDEAAW
jgi:hypothetical protein